LWNREQRCQGFTDIELSDKGMEQAELVGRYLQKTTELNAVYSSDLARAKKTAEIIARKYKLEVNTDPRLRELNQGQMEGKNLSGMLEKEPAFLEKWLKAPADFIMPGGESLKQLQARAFRAYSEIIARHNGQTVAIVGHNLANTTILCKILDLHLDFFRRLKQSTAALNEIEYGPYGPVIIRLNDTHFLNSSAAS
jgi:broad specificity phosphatase PhoE